MAVDQKSLDVMTRVELNHNEFEIEKLKDYDGQKGYFIRSYFIDNTFNQNGWGVTKESIPEGLKSGIVKDYPNPNGRTAPIILMPDLGHPPDETQNMRESQELFRVGNFLRVGFDEKIGKSYVDAEITDPDVAKRIDSGELRFVSPSVNVIEEYHRMDGGIIITKWRINHLAIVDKPAYGTIKAQIKGKCNGTGKQCLTLLSNVQANSIMKCNATGNLIIHLQGEKNEELTRWISELSQAHPDWEQDQILAVAFQKIRSSQSLKANSTHKQTMSEDQNDKEKKDEEKNAKSKKAEYDEDDDKKEQKNASEEILKKLDEQEKTLQSQANIISEKLIKPLAEKIAQAQVELDIIQKDNFSATVNELMKKPINDLETLEKSYSAMEKKIQNAGKQEQSVRFPYGNQQASTKDDVMKSSALTFIRSRWT